MLSQSADTGMACASFCGVTAWMLTLVWLQSDFEPGKGMRLL
jgi:hypothetical protein